MGVSGVCLLDASSKADFETGILQDLLSTITAPLVSCDCLLVILL
jgi:hypothetical protein